MLIRSTWVGFRLRYDVENHRQESTWKSKVLKFYAMNSINTSIFSDLKQFINHVSNDPDTLLNYGRDWSRLHEPQAQAIVFPESAEQVQQLVRYANKHHIALVPSGGRTGMSGAALALNSEIVVSFERMNNILAFDPVEGSVVCQPGVVTQTLQEYAHEQGLFYPVDFGARGSSHIGGNISTNAGGIKVIRYGLTRNWVTGLKVVTGKGDLLNLNNGLIKNATGYDLRHLFIGSEGTLGFIVEATIKLTRQPQEPRVMVLGVPELDGIMSIFGAFQRKLELNAFECLSARCLKHVLNHGLQKPFETNTEQYVLIEFDNTSAEVMENALEVYQECADQGWLVDGVISENQTQARELWRLREDITESIAPRQPYKNDVSVPVSKVADFFT